MSDIDLTEAIEAGRDGILAALDERGALFLVEYARAAVTAALPNIEHQVRMQVTRERLADAFEAEGAASTDERQVREQERARIVAALKAERVERAAEPAHVCDSADLGFCHRDAWTAALDRAVSIARGDS